MNHNKKSIAHQIIGQFFIYLMLLNILFQPLYSFTSFTPLSTSHRLINLPPIISNVLEDDFDISKEYVDNEKQNVEQISNNSGSENSEYISFIYSEDKYGVIGLDEHSLSDDPFDNLFTFQIENTKQLNEQVYLIANIKGVSNASGLAISVNEKLSTGGYFIKSNDEWNSIEIPIPNSDLKKGTNHIMFNLPQGVNFKYEIKDVKLKTSSKPLNDQVFLFDGNSLIVKDGKAYIKGFIRDSNVTVTINGIDATKQGNYFETFIDIPNNQEVDYLNISLKDKQEIKEFKHKINRVHYATNSFVYNLPKSESFVQKSDDFYYEINTSNYQIRLNKEDYKDADKISVQPLRNIDVPALGTTVVNTTHDSKAYRFLPDGIKFENEIGISLKYDINKIPSGYSEKDIKILYFDLDQRRWLAIKTDTIDFDNKIIRGLTTHFTDYISGIIQAPESPETNSFTPTSISGIEVANPTTNIVQIQPPTANQKGDGTIQFPITIPSARAGMQPSLALTYNNNGSSSSVGYGWDLSIPSIVVDTKLGVPKYSTTKETESYLMNGEELLLQNGNDLYLSHRASSQINRIPNATFFPKVEGNFSKIERKGTSPSDYYWIVTDKSGTKYYYGEMPESRLSTGNYSGNIAKWMLNKTIDKNGNYVIYDYLTKNYTTGNLAGGKEILINSITYGKNSYLEYNQGIGYDENAYHKIDFIYKNTQRSDQTINYRYGFKEINSETLAQIQVYSARSNGKIRGEHEIHYLLNYQTGAFGKQMLHFIKTINRKNNSEWSSGSSYTEESYTHKFDYYNDISNGLFGSEQIINTELDIDSRFSSIIGTTVDKDIDTGDVDFGVGVFGPALFPSYIPISFAGTLNFSYPFPSTYRSKQDLMLIDIDGDGLADKVFKKGDRFKYRKNIGGFTFSNDTFDIVNFEELSLTRTHIDNKLAPSASLVLWNVNFSSNATANETSIFLTDVNADGLVDYVKDKKVYFNKIDPNSGLPTFTTNSLETPNVIYKEGEVATGVLNEMPDLTLANDLMDVVKVWVAPKSGTINISGTITKNHVGLENGIRYSIEKSSNRILYSGTVRSIDDFGRIVDMPNLLAPVFISAPVFKNSLQSNQNYIQSPTLMLINSQQTNFNNISVNQGDMIYFRVNSSQVPNNLVDVTWDPQISYTTQDFDSPNGFKQYSSKYSDSFIYGNSSVTPILINKNGSYKLSWDALNFNNSTSVPEITDDVNVKVYLYKQIASTAGSLTETGFLPSQGGTLLTSFVIKRDVNNVFAGYNLPIIVNQLDESDPNSYGYLRIEVEAKSQINWKKFDEKFSPKFYDLIENTVVSVPMVYEVYKNQLTNYYKSTFNSSTSVRINNNFMLSNCNELDCQDQYIYLIAKNQNGKVPTINNYPLKFRYKINAYGNVIEKRQYSSVTNDYTVNITSNLTDITFNTGTSIYFEYYTSNSVLASKLSHYQNNNNLIYYTSGASALSVYTNGSTNTGLYRANIFYNYNLTGFGTLYRNWGQFAYKGAKPNEDFTPINRKYVGLSKLAGMILENPTQDEVEDQIDFFLNVNPDDINYNFETETLSVPGQSNLINQDQIQALKHFTMLKPNKIALNWQAHKKLFVSSNKYSPFLRYEGNEDLESLTISTPQLPGQYGAYAISRQSISDSSSRTDSFGFGPISLGDASNSGKTRVLNDFQDINGDGYPDIIGAKVQLTTPRGGLGSEVLNNNLLFNYNSSGSGEVVSGSSVYFTSILKANKIIFKNGGGSIGYSDSDFVLNTRSEGVLLDINGDGLVDQVLPNGQVLFNNGNGFISSNFYGYSDVSHNITNTGSFGLSGSGNGEQVVKDLQPDIPDGRKVLSNFDLSFGKSKSENSNSQNISFVDVNGDGLVDYIKDKEVFINMGSSFEALNKSMPKYEGANSIQSSKNINASISVLFPLAFLPIGIKIGGGGGHQVSDSYNLDTTKFMDFDGDGYLDIVYSDREDQLKVQLSNIRRTNMLHTVINPTGSTIELDYDKQNPVSGTNFGSTYKMPFKKWVLTKVVVNDGFESDGANKQIYAFEYANGLKDRRERKFLGFGEVKTHQLKVDGSVYRTSVTEYLLNEMPNSQIYLPGNSSDSRKYQYIGDLVRKQYTLDGANRILNENYTDYTFFNLTGGNITSDFITNSNQSVVYTDVSRILPLVKETRNIINHFQGNSNTFLQHQNIAQFLKYDKYGNVLSYKDLNENLGANISYHYINSGSDYIVNIPHKHEVIKNVNVLRRSATVLNNQNNIEKVIKTKTLENVGEQSIIDLEYDILGNLRKVIQPKATANSSESSRMFYEYRYDSIFNFFVTNVRDAYGYESKTKYNNFGLPVKVSDINNVDFYYTYDPTRRLKKFKGPYNEIWTIENEYFISPDQINYAVTKHNIQDEFTSGDELILHTASFADGLGRIIQTKKQLDLEHDCGGNGYRFAVSGNIFYDEFGRVKETYLGQEEINCGGDFDTNLRSYTNLSHSEQEKTSMFYDMQDRILQQHVYGLNATTSYEYGFEPDGFGIKNPFDKVILPEGNISMTFKDDKGRVTTSRQIAEDLGETLVTKYTYDALSQLSRVIDADDNITSYEYDSFGQKILVHHPDNGTSIFKYDLAGRLIESANQELLAQGQTITYDYNFNQLNVIYYPSHKVHYSYGDIGNGDFNVGRLIHVTDLTGKRHFNYGKLGEIINDTRVINSQQTGSMVFSTTTRFDSWGRILETAYPDGERLKYGYNTVGQLKNIINQENEIYLADVQYNFFDQPTVIQYGNEVKTINEYDITQRIRAMQLNRPDESSFMRTTYSYDRNQNITKLINKISQHDLLKMGGIFEKNYSYDQFNRLSTASGLWKGFKEDHRYELSMGYNKTHGITKKIQRHITQNDILGIYGETKNSYEGEYKYGNPDHPHAISEIYYSGKGNSIFNYDKNGNMIYYYSSFIDESDTERNFIWDEQNRLQAVIDNGGERVSHYVYDHTGERTFKAEGNGSSISIGGQDIYNVLDFNNYVIYPSGNLVLQPAEGKYTKHYYINNKRFASRIGVLEGQFSPTFMAINQSSELEELGIRPIETIVNLESSNNQSISYSTQVVYTAEQLLNCQSQIDSLLQQYHPSVQPNKIHCYNFILDQIALFPNKPCDVLIAINNYTCQDILPPDPDPTDPVYSPGEILEADCYNNLIQWLNLASGVMQAESGFNGDIERYKCYLLWFNYIMSNYSLTSSNACQVYNYFVSNFDCEKPNEIETPETPGDLPDDWQDGGANSDTTEEPYDEALRKPIWWYHTDHLGSSSYITDNFGRPSHYYDQLPFGESMVEHNQSSYYNNGYKFNGKELDEATGMYYYGARYYDPRISIFISVDPLAEKYPGWTPYHYVHNNPINMVDPTGMEAEKLILRGEAKQETLNELQKSVGEEITLAMDNDGNVSYTTNSQKLSSDTKHVMEMIDNQSITVEAITGNYNMTSPPDSKPFIGGAFMGSTYNEGNVVSTQEVNPFLLGKASDYVKSPGKGVAHELTEAFQGGKISLNEKRDVGGASRFGKNSDYLKAHKGAIKQPGGDQGIQQRFIHPNGSTSTDSKGAIGVEYFMKYRNNPELILETRK